MRMGSRAWLKMIKALRKEQEFDSKVYDCKFLRYDLEQECIYLVLEEGLLKEISLDAIYECVIEEADEQKIMCTGRVLERYCNKDGAVLKFEIENGFYKISVNYVDK